MGEPIKECWDRRQYHTGLAHIKRNRRTQFGISGAAIKPKWDGPTYPKGMTQLTNVAGPTLVKPAGPLQVSGLKILTSKAVSRAVAKFHSKKKKAKNPKLMLKNKANALIVKENSSLWCPR